MPRARLAVEVVDVAPGRPNLRAVLAGGGGPGLLLLGHTDVVPVGDGWTVDPFGGEVRDGRLYGRGSTDMKGGLAACVVAMTALRREGVVLSGPVELAALVDEEEHGLGIRRFVAENGGAYAACVVAEPTDLQTIIAARGDAYLDIVVHGSAAHSGRPDDGRNAIYGGAAVIASLQRWHEELTHAAHPLVRAADLERRAGRGRSGRVHRARRVPHRRRPQAAARRVGGAGAGGPA